MAARCRDDATTVRQILAELFEGLKQEDAAANELSRTLSRDPTREQPYRALCRLYLKQHEYDRAFCACAALAFLHKADESERRFFEDSRPRGMLQVRGRIANEHWIKNLFHEDEDLYIGKIFDMVTPAAMVIKTQKLFAARQLPVLDRRFRQDPATSTVTLAKTFGWAAQVLGLPLPQLYLRNDVPGALVAVPGSPPATVAGQSVLSGFTPQELTFIVGKHLAYYRSEHYVRNLYPTASELEVLLYGALRVAFPEYPAPEAIAPAVEETGRDLAKYMQPAQKQSLRFVAQRYIEEGAKIDIPGWLRSIELTAVRAGFVLCADLDIAKKVLSAEPHLAGDLAPGEKMKELLRFSVSDAYATVRHALGIAIG